jgi:hypothetical protein
MSSILEDSLNLKKLCDEFLQEVNKTESIINEHLKMLAKHYWEGK